MLIDSPIRDVPGDLPRKWLSDDSIELIVWFSEDDQIFGFQIHYDLEDQLKAFRFTRTSGFSHHLIDSGEDDPAINSSPILSDSIPVKILEIERLFIARSEGLPSDIRNFVLDHILEFIRRAEQGAAANP